MRAAYCRYRLVFHQPATTSRAVMYDKETYFIRLWNESDPHVYGIGECALFRGLSADDVPDYENRLAEFCSDINSGKDFCLPECSSIRFGYETALKDLANGGKRILYPSSWSAGKTEIPINGLVWMGNFDEMYNRINEKLSQGFRCVKLKVGGIDFESELDLIRYIRKRFSVGILELRLDANGAFSPDNALMKLQQLSEFQIQSIEQPIKAGQWEAMREICRYSPVPVALDEELIGVGDIERKEEMINTIRPRFIILKPALCGGLSGAEEWIAVAGKYGIGWWVTSALESNIGLNAISQWVATLNPMIPQGLGTGQLYANNFPSPLVQTRDVLLYNPDVAWNIPILNWMEP